METAGHEAESMTECKAVFLPSGKRGTFAAGTTLLQAARSLGVDIDSVCGGRAMCGRCQVLCGEGEFPKQGIKSAMQHLSDFGVVEQRYESENGPLKSGRRLACQARLLGNVLIDVPPESQVHRQVVRKGADVIEIELDPVVRLYYVEVQEPNMHDPSGDLSRLKMELEFEWGLNDLQCDLGLLQGIQQALAEGGWKVTVAVHDQNRIICVWPGFRDTAYGAAVDVGSTTIAVHLCDLAGGEVVASAGVMNPQIRFGEDLMSRVSYVMMNPGGDVELTNAVRVALDGVIDDLADTDVRRRIHDIVLVGNPVMHHLLLGIDPTPLGVAPFTLTVGTPIDMRATDLDLALPRARAHIGPCIAGHVGADAAAATLNEGTHRSAEPQLMVDVGTNAEIVLGTKDRTYAASSPTGPAFEGAQISCGMRATAGAIERIRIDRKSLEPRFKVIGSELWSDDPGFADDTAKLDIAGLCGSAIIEVIGEMFLAGVCDHNGVVRGASAERTCRVVADERTFRYIIRSSDEAADTTELAITQNDVRQIQLAAAALRAGIDLLMEHAGVSEVHDVRLAGAFGAHIDPVYALVLGLVPDCPVKGVRSVGNASGAGAVRILVSAAQRNEVAEAVVAIEKIETATEPRFQDLFVAAMAFPHSTAPTPHLATVVDLPEQIESDSGAGRARRRTRTNNRSAP